MIGPALKATPFLDEQGLVSRPWLDFFAQGDNPLEIPRRLIPGSILTTAAASYFESPTKVRTEIAKLTFANFSAGSVTVTVYLVPLAGAPGNGNLLTVHAIAAGETWDCAEAEGHVLEAGGTIQALADVDDVVTILGSGKLSQ